MTESSAWTRGFELYHSCWFVPESTWVSSAVFMSQEKRAHRLVASYCLTFISFHLLVAREAAAATAAGPFGGGNLVQSRRPTSCFWLPLFRFYHNCTSASIFNPSAQICSHEVVFGIRIYFFWPWRENTNIIPCNHYESLFSLEGEHCKVSPLL